MGRKDDKLYQSGMLLKADSDDKYIVVEKSTHYVSGTTNVDYVTYNKLDDAKNFMDQADVTATSTPVCRWKELILATIIPRRQRI